MVIPAFAGMTLGRNKRSKLAGVVGPAIIKKILKAPKTREYAVKGLAEGMKITADAKAAFQDMKDQAADICNDAKKEAGK